MSSQNSSVLSFVIGSPQAFIEPARTLRDLWAGSYIYSWLVTHAIQAVHERISDDSAFVSPKVDVESALYRDVTGEKIANKNATLPLVPNKFAAVVPSELAEELRLLSISAARNAWIDLAAKVREKLQQSLFCDSAGWDELWDDQIAAALEFEAVVLPAGDLDSKRWTDYWDELGGLLEMTRSIKHIPPYNPQGEAFPVKCSLMGSFEQMGPPNLKSSRDFWKDASGNNKGIEGTRIQKVDRLCAISLVKRFAWPVVISKRAGLKPNVLRYSDTATIAARDWLSQADINPDQVRDQYGQWSGQWLHWETSTQATDDDPCQESVFEQIKKAKKSNGSPPIYYAILNLDGDHMGRLFGGIGEFGWEGIRKVQEITSRMTQFGMQVVSIVESRGGELIYCGGDDVLAVVPAASAIQCSHELHIAFQRELKTTGVSLSGGIAIVHYKEDLRYALTVARGAERAAKRIDQSNSVAEQKEKSAIAIAVCRHSGEHSQFVMSWKQAESVESLIKLFQKGMTDRWVYRLREVLHDLLPIGFEAFESEIRRLLHRIDLPSNTQRASVLKLILEDLWGAYKSEMSGPGRDWKPNDVCNEFVTLLQSASFMARGKD